jgi:hypothetical protein
MPVRPSAGRHGLLAIAVCLIAVSQFGIQFTVSQALDISARQATGLDRLRNEST